MNELESEKVFELLGRHYNLNEANAISRCIFDDKYNHEQFEMILNTIKSVNKRDETDKYDYIKWLESL